MDLDDVGIARSGGGEGQADVAHGLGCLRSKVASTDDPAALVDGRLSCRIDGARPGGGNHLRERRVVEEALRTGMIELAHLSSLLPNSPKTGRHISNVADEASLVEGLRGLAALEDLVGLSTPQVPEREDRGQVLGTRTHLALLPVVNRLRRGADQETALGG